jgi:uncharacterized protein (DUF488 family)
MTANPPRILTIGHSTHDLESFLGLLVQHGISAVADVRSQPFSRLPHFNRDALAASLRTRGIKYIFLGKELGARRAEPECYVNGEAVYERVATLPLFRQGIDRLVKASREDLIALMCSEKEPLDCHRTLLVCRHLRCYPIQIHHILQDGHLEEHKQTEYRLMRLMGISPMQGELFSNPTELIEQAYEARGSDIAYRAGIEGIPA